MADKVKFTVPTPDGVRDIEVPELSWAVLEDHILPLVSLDENSIWFKARGNDVKMALSAIRTVEPNLDLEYVRSHLTYRQVQDLSARMREMLVLCGFIPAGEDRATSVSTETSTASSPI